MIFRPFLILLLLLFALSVFEEITLANKMNPDLSHWGDQAALQERLRIATHKHFAKGLHFIIGETMVVNQNRFKRDLGLLTSPVATAVVTGMIAKVVSDITAYRSNPSSGGCEWFGTAPLCNHACPSEYDFVRGHNGRCSNFWLASTCKPDDSFGEPCSTLLGSFFKKRFCCKSDPNDCTWSGRWMGATTAHNAYCRYDNNIGRCGGITCSINHHEYKAMDKSEIAGEQCDELTLFNMTGRATCGFIAWADSEGNAINSWYKTR